MSEYKGKTDIRKELAAIIAGLLCHGHGQVRITPATRIREDLGFDSVAVIDLMVDIEVKFGVYFDPLEHDPGKVFETVGSLERYILECMAKK